MKKIRAKTKNNEVVLLCARCQMEIGEEDTTCENCGLEYSNSNSSDWTLEPVDSTPQKSVVNQSYGPSVSNSQSSKKKMLFSKGKIISSLSILLLLCLYAFNAQLLNLISSPFIDQANLESKSLQLALTKYRKNNSKWPETINKLQYFQHITDNRISDFVLTANGGYNQILNSPFYLKGKVIIWRKSGQIWRCYSKELERLSLELPCKG